MPGGRVSGSLQSTTLSNCQLKFCERRRHFWQIYVFVTLLLRRHKKRRVVEDEWATGRLGEKGQQTFCHNIVFALPRFRAPRSYCCCLSAYDLLQRKCMCLTREWREAGDSVARGEGRGVRQQWQGPASFRAFGCNKTQICLFRQNGRQAFGVSGPRPSSFLLDSRSL